MQRFSTSALASLLGSDLAHEELAETIVVIDDDGTEVAPALVRSVPAIFVANEASVLADVVVEDDALDLLVEAVDRAPLAACALVLLLRGGDGRTIEDGLVAESTVYSMLQGGPEFAAWRQSFTAKPQLAEIGPAVQVEREGSRLLLTLSRPHVHNAFSRRVRDELAEALAIGELDPTVDAVELRGAGPSFCSGGDLAEFGSFPDPAASHLIRLTRSPARMMALVGPKTHVFLHGACMGAGIELPAFAHRVVAHPDAVIALPEVPLGLVPGAGGTVSIPRRIGRHRTAWLALSGERIDAETALAWGLVDAIEETTATVDA